MSDTDKKQVADNSRPDGMVMQIVTSLLCAGIGALLLFVPDVNVLYMCYCFCAALIVVGITLTVSYFVSGAYRKLNDYRFAIGILLIILGCIELLRAEILAAEIMFIIGLVTLVLAVIIMQSAVQMRILESKAWIAQLIFTIISMLGAVFVLVDFKPVTGKIKGFAYGVMVVTGVLCLISLIIEAIVLKLVEKKEADKAKEASADKAEENKPEISEKEEADADNAMAEDSLNASVSEDIAADKGETKA